MGTGLELDVITGVVLGGTSIFGGRGTIIGTALGLILIQALKNGLALSGVKGDGTIGSRSLMAHGGSLLLAAREVGVTRCGASRTAEILNDCRKRLGLEAIEVSGSSSTGY